EEIGIDWLPKDLHNFSSPLSVYDEYVCIGGEASEVRDAIEIIEDTSSLETSNPLYYQAPTEQEWTVDAMILLKPGTTGIQYLIDGINHGIRVNHGASNKPLFYLN